MQFALSAIASFLMLYGLVTLALVFDYGLMVGKDVLSADERKKLGLNAVIFIGIALAIYLLDRSLIDSDGKSLGALALLAWPWLMRWQLKKYRR